MTRRRWIADEVDLARNRAALVGQNALHLARVLRARAGQEFDLVLPPGGSSVHAARIVSVADSRVEFELGEQLDAVLELTQVDLYLAVFKFDRMEWAIEKATELGVSVIIPVIARRTEKHLAVAAEKRVDRWRRVAHEASQQSRRGRLPQIAPPQKLGEALEQPDHDTARIVLAENEKQTRLKGLLQELGNPHQLSMAVGPEGGWTRDELALFAESGWRAASLGPAILRAETAAIAALAITLSG